MKKYVSIMAVLLLFGLTMWAQSQAGSPDQSSGSSSGSMSGQDSSQSSGGGYGQSSGQGSAGMSQSSSAGSQTVEGCIVREETDYYIVPEQGSAQKLNGNPSQLNQHVGHHVQVQGTTSGGSTASSTASGSNAGSQEFNVAEVDMISTNCPANWNPSEMSKHGQGTSGKTGANPQQ
jgi:hypothetical protein